MTKEEDARRDGYEFEKYISDLFPTSKFEVIKNATRYEDAMEEDPDINQKPDLCVRIKNTQYRFWIECKYRNKYTKNGRYDNINWCTEDQLERYREFALQIGEPIYIAIGVEGVASGPRKLYLIPLEDINSHILYESVYSLHERPNDAIIKIDFKLR